MADKDKTTPGGGQVYPAERAGWLATSLRRLIQNPETILRGLVREGETAVDIGCGPGFFTLPLARMVGKNGAVAAVDLQQAMLDNMLRRAEHAGLQPRIRPILCSATSLGYSGPADFALAFHVAHEAPDVTRFLGEIHGLLKPQGKLLLVEPRFHVRAAAFEKTVEIARMAGFRILSEPQIGLSRAAFFSRD